MKVYQPEHIEAWPQVFLNGLLRPYRFFVLSKWRAKPYLSFLVICSCLLVYTLVFQKAILGKINWVQLLEVLIICSTMSLIFPVLMHYFRKNRGWSIYGVFSSYLCFLSYIFVCFCLTLPLAFFSPYYFFLVQIGLVVWSAYGFSQSFLNLNFSDGYKALAVYIIFFVGSYMLVDQKKLIVEYIDMTRGKVKESTVLVTEQSSNQTGESLREHYQQVVQIPRFKENQIFTYRFQFRSGEFVRTGSFRVYVRGYDPDYNVASVKVSGEFLGRKKVFKQELRLNQPIKDISSLMKSQKWSVITATRILFSSYGAAVMLPHYVVIDGSKKKQKLQVKKTKHLEMDAYDILNLPGLWPKTRKRGQVKMNVRLSPEAPIPVHVSGFLPRQQGYYSIKLIEMELVH